MSNKKILISIEVPNWMDVEWAERDLKAYINSEEYKKEQLALIQRVKSSCKSAYHLHVYKETIMSHLYMLLSFNKIEPTDCIYKLENIVYKSIIGIRAFYPNDVFEHYDSLTMRERLLIIRPPFNSFRKNNKKSKKHERYNKRIELMNTVSHNMLSIVRSSRSNRLPYSLIGNYGYQVPKNERFIYMLFDNEELVYIGSTTNIKTRLATHKREKVKKFNSFNYFKCSDFRNVEAQLIQHLKPKYNVTYNTVK